MKRLPVCKTCRRAPHAPGCQATKLREEARYTADILEQWGAMMSWRWTQTLSIFEKFGVFTPSNLEIKECAILECGSRGRFLIKVQDRWLTPKEALENPLFDKSTLPTIRHAIMCALDEYDYKIKEAQVLLEGLHRKIMTESPKPPPVSPGGNVLDEFGADIMQYGPAPGENKMDGPAFLKSTVGFYGGEISADDEDEED